MRNQKGVTLVALVVTIIVLIILAGISINLVLGENGIITLAKKAKENTELAKEDEETNLNEAYEYIENGSNNVPNNSNESIAKLTEFKIAIANAIEEAGGIKPDPMAETAVFANNIKGIVKEVTKNATATAEDIANNKTAYVNGELITGTASLGTGSICFAGSGGSGKSVWTTVGYSSYQQESSICSLSNSSITFSKDCNITMQGTVFPGRRSNGSTNSAYIRVLVDGSVLYTSSAITNTVGTVTFLNNYNISSGSAISIQVYGTDETTKMHSIIIKVN